MNNVYKVIWNEVSATFVAVAELVKGRSKSVTQNNIAPREVSLKKSVHFFIKPLVAALICIGFTFAVHATPMVAQVNSPAATQLPTGSQISAGAATVSQSGSTMNVKQDSSNASINWQTFNVGSQATVNFIQPSSSSVILNRVLDSNPSQIYGKINSNGSVFLENPSGVYFSPSATVDTGSFLATTATISDADFMAGKYTFNRSGSIGKILNEGRISSALGGYIALLAPEVRNLGVVVAKGGSIVLAAGETYQLQFENNNTLTNILVSPSTVASFISNGNAIEAPGGLIILSAQAANAIQGGVIKNTGSITADVLINDGGVIRLVASDSITNSGVISADAQPNGSGNGGHISLIADTSRASSKTQVGGTISAKGGGEGGNGGEVETSGAFVQVDDGVQINTSAPKGTGGSWLIDPTDFTVGTGGDISGAALGANLTTSSVTILSSSGHTNSTGNGGNINVNDAVSWSGSNKLTLSAANNINIDNAINVPSGGSVTLIYGTDNGTGSYNFGVFGLNNEGFSGSINFAGTGSGLFTTQLGSNSSAAIAYKVINNPSTYVSSTNATGGINSNSGNFALAQNYSFGTSFTNSPITGTFTGHFDGLGHTVSNINGTGSIGLFSNSSGFIQNVGVNMSTTSAGNNTGGLVNSNSGFISNSFSNATISSNSNNTTGTFGGLVGSNSGLITNAFSTGSITGGGTLGGLVGYNGTGSSSSPSNVLNSFSTVNVTGTGNEIGGLIGYNTTTGTGASSTVTNSFSTGNVYGNSGAPYAYGVGGLIGYNNAAGNNSTVSVFSSYSSSTVSGPSSAGANYNYAGLIGLNQATNSGSMANISGSYSTGAVNASASGVGGLVGTNRAVGTGSSANFLNDWSSSSVNNSLGPVSSAASFGGLVAANSATAAGASATIVSSYSYGAVYGNNSVGGLVGGNTASLGGNVSISSSYSSSNLSVSGSAAGGLVGYNTLSGSTASNAAISGSYATGNLTVMSNAPVNGQNNFGGLIGINTSSGTTNHNTSVNLSYATGNVVLSGGSSGGLIGSNTSTGLGTVSNSYATGNVSTSGANVGGLIGSNTSNLPSDSGTAGNVSVANSYALGNVSGSSNVGGLVGYNLVNATSGSASISAAHSAGNVTGTSADVGGLVGQNNANSSNTNAAVTNSYVDSQTTNILVQGTSNVGGLIGLNSASGSNTNASITSAYSSAQVVATGSAVGGLIGNNTAGQNGAVVTVSQSYASGNVSGASSVGGLLGSNTSNNASTANVTSDYSTGTVSGTLGNVGGLIGANYANTSGVSSSANIQNSYSTGIVSNVSGTYTGGLIGINSTGGSGDSASISNSYATGSVTSGGNDIGGLVGYNLSNGKTTISQSYATGYVTTNSATAINLGGLVGYSLGGPSGSNGSISQSYASGGVSAPGYSSGGYGGLIGQISAGSGVVNVDQSYSTGTVQTSSPGTYYLGGLIGYIPTSSSNSSVNITNSYSTGNVQGVTGNYLGGFVGGFLAASHGAISSSYETGSVSGSTHLGGFIGSLGAATTLQNNYWNKTNNGSFSVNSGGVGGTTLATAGVSALSTAQMQVISNFTGWDTSSIWQSVSYFNNQLPFLKSNNTLATITLVSGSSIYGSAPQLHYSITNSFGNAITGVTAVGTPVWSLSSNGTSLGTQSLTSATNAGIFSLTYSSGITFGNYTIVSGNSSNWTISPAPLGLSVVGLYNGTTTLSPTAYTLSGLVNGETLIPSSVAINNANVASSNNYVKSIISSSGTARLSNYQLASVFNSTPNTTSSNFVTLNPIALSVSASASNNIYDGSSHSGTYTTSAMIAADVNLISVTGVASGTDAGSYSSNLAVTLSGSALTNYTAPLITNGNLVISPKSITITNSPLVSTYDAVTTYSSLASQTTFTATTLVGADTLGSVTQTANLTGVAQAGTYTVTPSAASLATGNANNYIFHYLPSTNTVNRLALTVANTTVESKTYDGTTTASIRNGSLVGVISSDNVTLVQAGAFVSPNAGSNVAVNVADTLTGSSASNYTITQPTGISANIIPKALSVTSQVGVDKVYDATTTAVLTGGTLSGVVGSDAVQLVQAGTFASAEVANGIAITPNNSLMGASANNYSLTQPTNPLSANITPALLTVTGLSATSKIYDGTTVAVLTGTATSAPLGGGEVTINGTPQGNYLDPNVGSGKYINVTGFTLSGANANDYQVSGLKGVLGDITPATLIASGLVAQNKIYDSTTSAILSGGSLQGLKTQSGASSPDQVVINTGTFASKNVGTSIAVTPILSGAQAANYVLASGGTYRADITPASVTVSQQSASDKVYDSTTIAQLSNGILNGVYSVDSVVLVQAGSFVDKNVGVGKLINPMNTLSGADAGNYSLTQPSLTATITPATLTVSGLTVSDKVYDASTAATITGNMAALSGVLASDHVALSGSATANFADPNVGVGKSVIITNVGITGDDAKNYVLSSNNVATANITKADLNVAGTSVLTKVYDATTVASLSGGSLVGVKGNDTNELSLVQSGSFADKNVGTSKPVSAADTLTGSAATNYNLIQPNNLTGNITPASLTVSGLTVSDKFYDGSNVAYLTGNPMAHPLGHDDVSFAGAPDATFSSVNAGSHIPVNASNFTLIGADASNYSVSTLAGLFGNINPAPLTAQVNPYSKVYDGNTSAAPTLFVTSGLVGNESIIVTGTGSLDNKNAGQASSLTVSSISLANGSNGGLASNYSLQPGQIGSATVLPAPLTAIVANPNKVYDGTIDSSPVMTITSGLVGSETVNVTASATYNSKNVSSANSLNIYASNITDGANGGLARNYTLSAGQSVPAHITPAPLIASIDTVSSVYGSAVNPGEVNLTGILGSDVVTGTGSVANPQYSSGHFLKTGNYSQTAILSGVDSGNYTIASYSNISTNYTVTPLALTASISAGSSNYGASLQPGAVTLAGVLPGDDVGSIASLINPVLSGSGKVVVGSYSQNASVLTGADSGNYSFSGATTPSANYTVLPIALTQNIASVNATYGSSINPGVVSLNGAIPGDDVTSVASIVAPAFSSSNHLKAGSYNQSTSNLVGADANNYTFSAYTTPTPNLVVSPLSVTSTIAAVSLNYGSALSPGAATLSGILSGDVVQSSATVVNPSYSTSGHVNAGAYSQVASALSGVDSANYALSGGVATSPNYVVKALPLTAASISAASSTYGSSVLPGTVQLTGILSGDTVNSSSSLVNPTYSSSQHVNAGAYNQTATTITGADAKNYTFTTFVTSTPNYSVSPLGISASLLGASSVYGAPLSLGVVGFTGVLQGDDLLSTAKLSNPSYSTSKHLNVGSYALVVGDLTGADVKNYVLLSDSISRAVYTVDPLSINASIAAVETTYGTNTSAGQVTLSGNLNTDDVTASASIVNPSYSSSNHLKAGAYAQLASLNGVDAKNYKISTSSKLNLNYMVNPLPLVGSISTGSSLEGSAFNPGEVTFMNALTGDSLGHATVLVSIPGDPLGSQKSSIVGTFLSSQSVASLSGPDASNYSYGNVKGDYTVKAGFVPASIYPSSNGSGMSLSLSALKQEEIEIAPAKFSSAQSIAGLGVGKSSSPEPNAASIKEQKSNSPQIPLDAEKGLSPSENSSNGQDSMGSRPGVETANSSIPLGKQIIDMAKSMINSRSLTLSTDNNPKTKSHSMEFIQSARADEMQDEKFSQFSPSNQSSNSIEFKNKENASPASEGRWDDEIAQYIVGSEHVEIIGETVSVIAVTLPLISIVASIPIVPLPTPLPLPTSPGSMAISRFPNRLSKYAV